MAESTGGNSLSEAIKKQLPTPTFTRATYRHKEHLAGWSVPVANVSLPAQGTAIRLRRSHARRGRDGPARALAHFWQVEQESLGIDGTHARNVVQPLDLCAPLGAGGEQALNLHFDFGG